MKSLSLMTAVSLSLALSPLAATAASADLHSAASPQLRIVKALALVHRDDEEQCADRSLAAQARRGAFLEMTSAAP